MQKYLKGIFDKDKIGTAQKMGKRLPKIISQEDFEKIFKAEHDKSYKLAFLLGFEAGMRISEIVGLEITGQWKIKPLAPEQIDLQGHTIRVVSGKGGKDRIVPLPDRFNTNALKLLPLDKSRRALQGRITELGKKVLGKEITFHTLRHGFASHLVGKGRPIHEVQMLLGHSRLDTTAVYLHANPKEAVEGARDVF